MPLSVFSVVNIAAAAVRAGVVPAAAGGPALPRRAVVEGLAREDNATA